jgi:hypothetical protein
VELRSSVVVAKAREVVDRLQSKRTDARFRDVFIPEASESPTER